MNRRELLRIGVVGSIGLLGSFRIPRAHANEYAGKYLICVQADGGWDPTSFCDPKINQAGEPDINNWAKSASVEQAGNIPYAPFASNRDFFERHHNHMMVINGVDAQTNSHTVGVIHNWSGRNTRGFPTLEAIMAKHYGGQLPMSYLTFGGFSATGDLIRYTRLNDPKLVHRLVDPTEEGPHGQYIADGIWQEILQFHSDRSNEALSRTDLLSKEHRALRNYREALTGSTDLAKFADELNGAGDLSDEELLEHHNFHSTLRQQIELSVLAFKSGVAVSSNLFLRGFDTHANHDLLSSVLLSNLTDNVDYLWNYAETHGIADDLVVVLGSDFGRTNLYNSDNGKDHWPIGSYVVMQNNQSWTNRTVGETDPLHNAYRINPVTLARDDENGTIIHPKHVHHALRKHLGLLDSSGATKFPFDDIEEFEFFV